MNKVFVFFLFLTVYILFPALLLAQPANDDCENAIALTELNDWCSDNGAFTNQGAGPSGFGPASCFSSFGSDVWFSFVAQATDVAIVIEGATSVAPGGTLRNPEATLYLGNCNGTINEQICGSDNSNDNIIDIYKGGLAIGETYFIRVRGRMDNQGTFQLCINNFNPPVFPGSDCVTSAVLCSTSSFTIPQVIGAGNDTDEANGSSCLGSFGGSESNSTWFSWIAANNGILTFDLEPLNETDDLDFIIYELPNGVNDCSGKFELRCMAAGDFAAAFPSPCLGVTGLREGNTDVSEQPGCNSQQNNFLAPLTLEEGKAYALMVNNFSGTGSGFNVSFGGDAEFLGPEADLIISPITACVGIPVSFEDNSNFLLGDIDSWEWNFGVGATPATASGRGPIQVVYASAGIKSVALTVGTEDGCQITTVNSSLVIDNCCQTVNAINVDEDITNLDCVTIPTGAIDLTINSNVSIENIEWNTGATTPGIENLFTGSYMVSITNALGCDTTLTYEVGAPDGLNAVPEIVMPACAGGMDGSVTLNTSGGVTPYTYNWANGNTTNMISNIGVDIYNVTINDALGCEQILAVDVRELELELDSDIPVVTPPLCFDSNEGSVIFSVSNGTPPYEFDFNDGNGFTSNNRFDNLNAGIFTVDYRDASGCIGDTIVEVVPPDPLVLILEEIPITCFQADDGIAEVMVTGGVGNYSYQWDDPAGSTTAIVSNLMPGLVTVTVTDDNACEMTGSISITEPAGLFINVTGTEDLICFGDSTGSISVAGSGGVPGYSYSLDSINFSTDSILTDLRAGTYEVLVMDAMGCLTSVNATITEPLELQIEAGRDTIVDLGFPVRLTGLVFPFQRPVDIQWTPGMQLSCDTCLVTELTPTRSQFYFANIVDETGCTAIDSIRIGVNKIRPIYIPNVFSPNADGVNDFLSVSGNAAARQIQVMRIFNRWGALMYEGRNLPLNVSNAGWDGQFKNQPMSPGVYVYYILVDFIDGVSVAYQGDITILK